MNLDKKVSTINALIQDNAKSVFAGDTPDVDALEAEVVQFLVNVKKLPAPEAKQYLDIVAIWANEIRKISDKLNETKSSLQTDIDNAQAQGKAATAYSKATKFNQE